MSRVSLAYSVSQIHWVLSIAMEFQMKHSSPSGWVWTTARKLWVRRRKMIQLNEEQMEEKRKKMTAVTKGRGRQRCRCVSLTHRHREYSWCRAWERRECRPMLRWNPTMRTHAQMGTSAVNSMYNDVQLSARSCTACVVCRVCWHTECHRCVV